jgi:beta-galactosidase
MEQADWDGTLMEAPDFNEILDPAPGTEVLARFKGNYYDGAPALTCRALGKGRVYYYGAAFSEDTANVFLEKLGCAETYADIVSLTPGVEIAVREKAGHKWVILLNYLNESQKVDVRTEVRDAISGGTVSGAVEMPPYGVMILELP